jgi:hypothetical protein
MKKVVYRIGACALVISVQQAFCGVKTEIKGKPDVTAVGNPHPAITLESLNARINKLEEKFAQLSAEHKKLLNQTSISAKVPAIPPAPTPIEPVEAPIKHLEPEPTSALPSDAIPEAGPVTQPELSGSLEELSKKELVLSPEESKPGSPESPEIEDIETIKAIEQEDTEGAVQEDML